MQYNKEGILQLDKSDIKRINSGEAIAIIWDIDDVLAQAASIRLSGQDCDLSILVAKEILAEIQRRHDCTIGITWDVIDYHIQNYLSSLKTAKMLRKGKKK